MSYVSAKIKSAAHDAARLGSAIMTRARSEAECHWRGEETGSENHVKNDIDLAAKPRLDIPYWWR
jgi:hypothetical protein